jgi:tetratricopeptide (TPR) repeat protein
LTTLAVSLHAEPAQDRLTEARSALQSGEADKALSLLSSLPSSADAHDLRCRVLFTLEHWDAAGSECEKAVRLEDGNSGYHMWLGRTLGERASRASFMSAFSLAKHTRSEFEVSVRLDPRNAEALADLGEFYASAPGVVGGGKDKANGVAQELDQVDPARAHELRGQIAESDKDFGTAEREYKQAVAVSKHPAFQWMTLGSFYRRRSLGPEVEAAVQNGLKAAQRDKTAGVALFNGASVLTESHRNAALAAKMLEEYLNEYTKTEEAPAFVAHTRLARILAELGDRTGAQEQRTAALTLAHDYKPALELKF